VPRSTGLLHDPTNVDRIRFERDGLRSLQAIGGRVAAISEYMRAHLRDDYAVADAALLDLPDGLTAEEWNYEPPGQPVLPPPAAAGFLLAYGRAQPYKGWDDLIDALALLRADGVRLPHAVLAAVTDQPQVTDYQTQLSARIDARGVDATLVTRFDPAMRGLLAHPALRAVVVPSRAEPFGRVPLEAYAAGAGPVVVTTAGGLPEQVVDAVTGFTAQPADPQSLAAAIGRALGLSEPERQQMRWRGLQLVRTRFDHRDSVYRFFGSFAPWVCA
jgi:glycosyltransferase involved in cell wall biosynthesis